MGAANAQLSINAGFETAAFTPHRDFVVTCTDPIAQTTVRVPDEAGVSQVEFHQTMKHGPGWPIGTCDLLELICIDLRVHARGDARPRGGGPQAPGGQARVVGQRRSFPWAAPPWFLHV